MGFNVNDYSVGNGGSKVLEPGTHLCRIVDIKPSVPAYDTSKIQLTFIVEGQPEGGSFIGAAIDKQDPSKGNYEGKMAFVKASSWDFQEWKKTTGEVIDADTNACNFLANLANSLGVLNDMKKDPSLAKEVDINTFASVAKKYICDPDLWAYYTIGGKQRWAEGFNNPNYNMYFVKYENRKNYVSLKEDGVVPFDEEKHIVKTEKPISVTNDENNTSVVDIIEEPQTIAEDLF